VVVMVVVVVVVVVVRAPEQNVSRPATPPSAEKRVRVFSVIVIFKTAALRFPRRVCVTRIRFIIIIIII